MNCQTARVRVTQQLAAGVSELPAEVAAHYTVCRECQAHYETERALFVKIDKGLRSVVSQPVPASLVPSVRARLEDVAVSVSNEFSIPVWAFAAMALAVVLSIAMIWRHGESRSKVLETTPVASVLPPADSSEPAIQPQARRPHTAQSRRVLKAAATRNTPETTPEVIVLQEERDAYARFVAKRLQEHAMTLAAPASISGNNPVEISLLRIKGVEIEPLDSVVEQAR